MKHSGTQLNFPSLRQQYNWYVTKACRFPDITYRYNFSRSKQSSVCSYGRHNVNEPEGALISEYEMTGYSMHVNEKATGLMKLCSTLNDKRVNSKPDFPLIKAGRDLIKRPTTDSH